MAAQAQAGEGVNLGIIITPMLDMAFQLLAFFVMTYRPSAFEGQFAVMQTLPPEKMKKVAPPPKKGSGPGDPKDIKKKDEKEEPKDPKKAEPVDEVPKRSDSLVIFIKASGPEHRGPKGNPLPEGEPIQILVKKKEATEPAIISNAEDLLDKKLKSGGPFVEKLTAELDALTKAGAEADISLAPDGELRHEWVMYFMGVFKQKGFSKISFVEPVKQR